MERNSFMWLKLYTPILNLKVTINGLLSDPLTLILVFQGCLRSMLLYNIVPEVLANFINDDETNKGIQIGDHEIKIVSFGDNTTFFLRRDIACLNRTQVILKLYENAKKN